PPAPAPGREPYHRAGSLYLHSLRDAPRRRRTWRGGPDPSARPNRRRHPCGRPARRRRGRTGAAMTLPAGRGENAPIGRMLTVVQGGFEIGDRADDVLVTLLGSCVAT